MDYTFLISSERSGSNLMTRIMNNHSRYCGPSPVHLLRHLLDNRLRYGDLSHDRNWQNLLEDAVQLFNTKMGVWRSQWTPGKLQEQAEERTLITVFRTIYEEEARMQGKKHLFVKENHLHRYLSYVLAYFEKARFIYLVRDPRDMALSWKHSPNLRGCVWRAAQVWHNDQQESLKLLQWMQESQRIMLVKYEQLLAEPYETMEAVCAFLNIAFEEAMLESGNDMLTTMNARRNPDWKNLNNPLMTENFNKYREELLPEEIEYIEALCGREMDLLGYRRELDQYRPFNVIEADIRPLELREKPAYYALPQQERALRDKRRQVLQTIEHRREQTLSSVYRLERASFAEEV